MEKAENSNKEAKTTKQKQKTLKTQRTSTVWRESDVLLALGKQQIDASEAILQYKRPKTANKKQNTKSNTENAKSVKNIKNVAVTLVLLVSLKKSTQNEQTGGVPLPFVHSGNIIWE